MHIQKIFIFQDMPVTFVNCHQCKEIVYDGNTRTTKIDHEQKILCNSCFECIEDDHFNAAWDHPDWWFLVATFKTSSTTSATTESSSTSAMQKSDATELFYIHMDLGDLWNLTNEQLHRAGVTAYKIEFIDYFDTHKTVVTSKQLKKEQLYTIHCSHCDDKDDDQCQVQCETEPIDLIKIIMNKEPCPDESDVPEYVSEFQVTHTERIDLDMVIRDKSILVADNEKTVQCAIDEINRRKQQRKQLTRQLGKIKRDIKALDDLDPTMDMSQLFNLIQSQNDNTYLDKIILSPKRSAKLDAS